MAHTSHLHQLHLAIEIEQLQSNKYFMEHHDQFKTAYLMHNAEHLYIYSKIASAPPDWRPLTRETRVLPDKVSTFQNVLQLATYYLFFPS